MPPKVAPNANPLGLTTREIEIMVLSWKCIEGDTKVQIDSNKLAALANIGKAESASRMWRGIKSKIESATVSSGDGDGGAGPSAPATPAETTPKKKATTRGGKKRGKKDVDTEEDDDSENNERKVTKAKKQPAKRAKKQPAEAAAADSDHEEGHVLPNDEDA
ncbi:hypothetical protein VPNG_08507 [Cytospora leucostoma]|uniref:Uncharacterized protein n=1 Tax=Cytospora leucostoma TaxID=1230097 RepID=A0A423W551_9PEZI|nr:hypothetical protein VPNG_08507 [Cytospora leucostoma]